MYKKKEQTVRPSKEKQSEFFAEFQASGIKKPAYFFRQDFLIRKKINLNISYENFVLMFIVFIMLLVIFFSLGVERGKRITRFSGSATALNVLSTPDSDRETTDVVVKEYKDYTSNENVFSNDKNVSSNIVTGTAKTENVTEEVGKETTLSRGLYTIQVIAFKKEENAKKEIVRLEGEGYEVFAIPSPSREWTQVCVGRYPSKDDSKDDLEALQKRYPSSYIRKIQD